MKKNRGQEEELKELTGEMKRINPGIFKAYDIRGIYPDEVNEEIMMDVGRAFVAFLGEEKIVVGRDMRLSSPALSRAFIQGALEQGADVVDIGLCSTDMLYFASGVLNLPGAMFTASHNPKEYNGAKFCRRLARPISIDTGLGEIKRMVLEGDIPEPSGRGSYSEEPMLDRYVEHVLGFVDVKVIKPLRVVVDAGNGMAGMIVPALFEKLPCELIPYCFELDGSFPHHQPNPIDPANIKLLSTWVKENRADVGMAFDGDADRVFLVDDMGEPISGSLTNAILISRILDRNPSEKIIYNAINSWIVPETIKAKGGIPIKERVGHSFIKQTMLDTGAIFAGEHSGHYYFRDNYNADSGLIAALMVLEIISIEGRPLSEILKPYKKYHASGEINSRVEDIPGKLVEIERRYSDGEIEHIDGISVFYPDWWFNVRPSNTEPLIRLNVEAKTKELLNEKVQELLSIIRS